MSTAPSAERILAILGFFTEDRPEWTPEELMQATGYTRPTLYRYLKALKEAGLLASLPNAGYMLGPRVVELDYLMRKSDALVRHGQRHLVALSGAWPCSALLVRWYGNKLLCVASECSTPNPLSSYPRGKPMPLARGAISRAIMAYLPRRVLDPMIRENLDDLRAVGLGTDVAQIADSLRRVRRRGVAVAHGEVTPGVVGVSSPIFDAGEAPIAAICVTIAGTQVTGDTIEDISARVRTAASEVSAALAGIRHDGGEPIRHSA